MTIVYCIASIYNSGGKDRVICNKANWLVQNGYTVYIITTDQRGRPPYFYLDDRVTSIDLSINYEQTNSLPLFSRIIIKWKQKKQHFKALQKLFEQIVPDVLISTFEEDGFLIPKLGLKCPIIVELHYSKSRRYYEYARGELDCRRLLDWWRTKNDELTIKKYDQLVVLTKNDLHAWHCMPQRCAIPNPISFDVETLSKLNQKKILAVGRYSHEKNFEALIEMWSELAPFYPDWSLEIVGDGYLRSYFEILGRQLLENGQLLLTPSVKNIKEKYLASSISVLTSHYEGFPLVILEAMCCGLPVVSFDCPFGPREMIEDKETGFLIKPNDCEAFKDSLRLLLDSQELRYKMGRNAKVRSNIYSLDNVMSKWYDLFQGLSR